jgi:GNAT superfamily N-acetyltransferase
MDTNILTDLSTPALVRANKQNLYDLCWALRGTWKQAVFYENNRLRRWWSPIPLAFVFNAAISLQPPHGLEADLIDETIAFFETRERQDFDWWLAPGLETGGWGTQLEAKGLRFAEGEPGMALDLGTLSENLPLPAGLKIHRVTDDEMMKTWAKIFFLGYELPLSWETSATDMFLSTLHTPMINYLAEINDQPVATSTLFLDAGVAGIYNVATLPEWRGRGLGAAVTLHALLEARQQGFKAGILQSSDMGHTVYKKLGFKDLCRMNHYHWQSQPEN